MYVDPTEPEELMSKDSVWAAERRIQMRCRAAVNGEKKFFLHLKIWETCVKVFCYCCFKRTLA